MTAKLLCFTSTIALASAAQAQEMSFNRIASFATPLNMAEGEDASRETSAEIIAAAADGMTLVYTDSPLGVLGFIDISDPADPKPLGKRALEGEPTSVTVIGATAFVGVNTGLVQSGLGREGSRDGIDEFTELKCVCLPV